jgi:hypothetical protein
MLKLHLNDLITADPKALARQLSDAGRDLSLTLTVDGQYQSNSKYALAYGWLRTWYIAESLAQHASQLSCAFEEGEHGAAEFAFEFRDIDAAPMAKKLVEYAAVFDPDELEAGNAMLDESQAWLEKNGNALKPKFPELEEAYRGDLAVAQESNEGDDNDGFEDES